jgi:hypothetical protein
VFDGNNEHFCIVETYMSVNNNNTNGTHCCVYPATMVTPTRHSVTLHTQCPGCPFMSHQQVCWYRVRRQSEYGRQLRISYSFSHSLFPPSCACCSHFLLFSRCDLDLVILIASGVICRLTVSRLTSFRQYVVCLQTQHKSNA